MHFYIEPAPTCNWLCAQSEIFFNCFFKNLQEPAVGFLATVNISVHFYIKPAPTCNGLCGQSDNLFNNFLMNLQEPAVGFLATVNISVQFLFKPPKHALCSHLKDNFNDLYIEPVESCSGLSGFLAFSSVIPVRTGCNLHFAIWQVLNKLQ